MQFLVSNYWSPKLYFRAENGSFLDVPIIGDNEGGNLGGMAIYYCKRIMMTTFTSKLTTLSDTWWPRK
jgi:hypothetical protein